MNSKTLIYISALLIAVLAIIMWDYGDHRPEPKSAAEIDSVTSSPQPTISAVKQPDPIVENLDSGTALARITVKSVKSENNLPGQITVNVDAILGYGSATPVLGADTVLNLDISEFVKSNPEWRSEIKENATLKVILGYQKSGIGQGDEVSAKNWRLIKFQK